MKVLHSTLPTAKAAHSIIEFIERLDRLAFWSLPLKGDESHSRSMRLTQYYRMEAEGVVFSPWVDVIERADCIVATVSGNDGKVFEPPEEAFEAIRADCRERLRDVGIEPAF